MHTTTHFDYERRRHSSPPLCEEAFVPTFVPACLLHPAAQAVAAVEETPVPQYPWALPQESHAISAAPAKANQRVLLARLRRRRAAGLQRLFRSYQARREYPEPALLRHEHAHVPRTLHCPVAAREGHMPRVPRRNTLNVVVTRCLPSAPPLRHRRGSKRALLSFPL